MIRTPVLRNGVAGEPQAADIIMCAEPLVGDVDVDVAEIDDVADIGRGAIEFLLWAGHGFWGSCGRFLGAAEHRTARRGG
jgi:hypothetical protein